MISSIMSWKIIVIEKLSNEAVSFTAGEMFASSQVDARAGKETYAEEAEEGFQKLREKCLQVPMWNASMKKGIEVEDTTAKVNEVSRAFKEQKLERLNLWTLRTRNNRNLKEKKLIQ